MAGQALTNGRKINILPGLLSSLHQIKSKFLCVTIKYLVKAFLCTERFGPSVEPLFSLACIILNCEDCEDSFQLANQKARFAVPLFKSREYVNIVQKLSLNGIKSIFSICCNSLQASGYLKRADSESLKVIFDKYATASVEGEKYMTGIATHEFFCLFFP